MHYGNGSIRISGFDEIRRDFTYRIVFWIVFQGLTVFVSALCRKMFEDDPDASAEDVESELAVIL